jgi:hypothetical protein
MDAAVKREPGYELLDVWRHDDADPNLPSATTTSQWLRAR